MIWQACQEGKYQHIFKEVDKPFKMQGKLIRWASICGRAFAYDPPIENSRLKKCKYCERQGDCRADGWQESKESD